MLFNKNKTLIHEIVDIFFLLSKKFSNRLKNLPKLVTLLHIRRLGKSKARKASNKQKAIKRKTKI